MTFGRMVVIRRTMLNMRRNDLVAASGLSYPYVSDIEAGRKEPSYTSLGKLRTALQFDTISHMFQWLDEVEKFMEDHG